MTQTDKMLSRKEELLVPPDQLKKMYVLRRILNPMGTMDAMDFLLDKLHDATEKALQDPAMKEKLAKLGVEPELMSVDAFSKYVKDDLVATVQLAKDANIQPVD